MQGWSGHKRLARIVRVTQVIVAQPASNESLRAKVVGPLGIEWRFYPRELPWNVRLTTDDQHCWYGRCNLCGHLTQRSKHRARQPPSDAFADGLEAGVQE